MNALLLAALLLPSRLLPEALTAQTGPRAPQAPAAGSPAAPPALPPELPAASSPFRRSFEVGTGTSLELVQSAGALRQAELQLVLREFQLQETQVTAFLAEAACDW